MTRRAAVVFLFASVAAITSAAAQIPKSSSLGRSTVHIPDRTTLGAWDGTWFHVARDYRVALWMRSNGGVPELRMQYFRIGQGEQFATDWTGSAHYDVDGAPGTFSITMTEKDADVITATWDWDLDFADSGRYEDADLTIYRAADGRQLVIVFDNFTRRLRRGQNIQKIDTKMTWTFRQASKRLILWDELPF